jgi:signal transduction histidine kinase
MNEPVRENGTPRQQREMNPLTREQWYQLPFDLRQRWWRETEFDRKAPPAELLVAVHEALTAEEEMDLTKKLRERARDELDEAAADEIERLRTALTEIEQWAQAYPLDVFPEPDLKRAHVLLQAGGMTLDAVSARAMRHVLSGVADIVHKALSRPARH